jgi:hypothetical protein
VVSGDQECLIDQAFDPVRKTLPMFVYSCHRAHCNSILHYDDYLKDPRYCIIVITTAPVKMIGDRNNAMF